MDVSGNAQAAFPSESIPHAAVERVCPTDILPVVAVVTVKVVPLQLPANVNDPSAVIVALVPADVAGVVMVLENMPG